MKILQLLRRVAPAAARDVAGFGGAALFSVGAWQAWHPAGLLVAGLILMGGATLSAARS